MLKRPCYNCPDRQIEPVNCHDGDNCPHGYKDALKENRDAMRYAKESTVKVGKAAFNGAGRFRGRKHI